MTFSAINRLYLDQHTRHDLWQHLMEKIEKYLTEIDEIAITPELDPARIRRLISEFDFDTPLEPAAALEAAAEGLRQYQLHTAHPQHFGLFNPTPVTMGIAADALVAAFNPQLAAWGHNPFAVEVEQHLIHAFAQKFGYPAGENDGTFTSGGAEANLTALLTALTHRFPEYAQHGLRGLKQQPVFYVSSESHHSFVKAARSTGLGTDAIRVISIDPDLRMDTVALQSQVRQDREAGCVPFMVVATFGTTSAGIIDPIEAISAVAAKENLWFHVDAAWGGAAILVEEMSHWFAGIEHSDSITLDAHKWLSVPMAAGMFLTRHPDILQQSFRVTPVYIPGNTKDLDVVDPYTHSIQWSRRFIGLKVFLSLTVAGWQGYRDMVKHQIAMGRLLKTALQQSGWKILNSTDLPVICFVPASNTSDETVTAISQSLVATGQFWISTTRCQGMAALRACVTSFRTTSTHIDALVHELDLCRNRAFEDGT